MSTTISSLTFIIFAITCFIIETGHDKEERDVCISLVWNYRRRGLVRPGCLLPIRRHGGELIMQNINEYDTIICAFSGGKDSLACVLHLLDIGANPSKIELWHHDVDGRESEQFMDWPVTADYCRKIATALNLPIYFSWREGGFEREMTRRDTPTAPTYFQTPRGIDCAGGKGRIGTREKFPQVSADLKVRWCSAYLKIDVCAIAIRNQERFKGKRTLVVTGERAEESSARSKYRRFERHRTDGKARRVDHWRPCLDWLERNVWDLIEAWRVNPHPAYRLGWGRLSCAGCIFGSRNQMASFRVALPGQFQSIRTYEKLFGVTIKRNETITESADRGTPYSMNPEILASARSTTFDEPVFVMDWMLPSGAFGDAAGPS